MNDYEPGECPKCGGDANYYLCSQIGCDEGVIDAYDDDPINNDPVPIPGKGENSWDGDDDAVYAQSLSAENAEHAAVKFVESIKKTRRDRGWKEREKA